jgi:Na+/serine symporter
MNGSLVFRVVSVCLLVLLCVNVAAVAWTIERNDELRQALVSSCERGNIVRVKQNAVIAFLNKRSGFAGIPTPLVDCEEIP